LESWGGRGIRPGKKHPSEARAKKKASTMGTTKQKGERTLTRGGNSKAPMLQEEEGERMGCEKDSRKGARKKKGGPEGWEKAWKEGVLARERRVANLSANFPRGVKIPEVFQ